MVSAPGKVIVYGEHAVVHGKVCRFYLCPSPEFTTSSGCLFRALSQAWFHIDNTSFIQAAIAAALSLRSYLLVTPLLGPTRKLTLRFPDIGLDHSWDIDSLPWSTFSMPGKKKYYFDTVERLDNDLANATKPLVAGIPGKVLQAAASAFLYVYLMLGSKHAPASIYTIRSTVPIGAGLGSSASTSVCLSTALQLQMGTLATPFNGMMPSETQLQLKRINNWAFVGEMCIHGNPSGVDNTVATGGKAVLFKRTDYSLPPQVTHLSK